MLDSLINLIGQFFLPFLVIALIFTFCMRAYESRRRSMHRGRYELAGKYVLITGASSGLGSALAEEFYSKGAKVILAARSLDKLGELRQSLRTNLRNKINNLLEPEVVYLDLAQSSQIDEAVKAILKLTGGRLDVLVNNAGMSMRGSCTETSLEVHRQLMEVNYFGHVHLTQSLLNSMIETAAKNPTISPCIVCISSVQGRISIPYRSSYAASKHAFQAYFDSLRSELSIPNPDRKSVRVFVVSPGYIQTNISLNALTGDGGKYGKMDETTRKGMTSEIAAKFIVDGLLEGCDELVLAPTDMKFGIAIRALMPSLYFWLMAKRAAKGVRDDKE